MNTQRVPLSIRASVLFFLISVVAAIGFAAYGAYDLGAAYSYIHQYTPPYLYPLVNEFSIYLAWIVTLAAVVFITYSILFGRKSLTQGTPENRSSVRSFSAYLAAFALLDLFLSEIEAIAGIAPSSLGMPNNAAIVVFGFSAILFSLLMQLATVYPLSYLFRSLESRGAIDSNSQHKKWRSAEIVLIAAAADLVIGYFVPFVGPASLSMLLSVILLNYICLKSGFTRALLAYFISTMFSVISFLVLNSFLLSILLTVFLLMWAFIGFSWIASVMMGSMQKSNPQEHAQEMAKRYIEGTDYSKLWVRSTCPNCGESKFHLEPDGSLKCDKCNQIVEKDTEGRLNIIIQNRRII